MVAPRFQPEEIRGPLDERMIEAIQKNFEYLFRDLVEVDDKVIPVPGGGTGLSAAGAGDLLVGTGGPALDTIPDVAAGNVLLSGGVGAPPAYGKVGLATHVTGILPIANGGTGQDTAPEAFDALSPLTTKGDLLAHTGVTNTRLPVGTDGQTLVADAASAAGVKWTTGGSTHEILQHSVHTDADTQTRVLGDLISALGPSALEGGWEDGLPSDLLVTELDTTGGAYWADGLPYDGVGAGESGTDVLWRRLPIGSAGQVLKSNGSYPEWGDLTEITATDQPKVRVYSTTNQTIASGAGSDDSNGGTKVLFDSESFDSHGFHSTSSNTSRLTVPTGKAGTYLIVAQASWLTSATGRKACWPYKNGTVRLGVDEVNGDDGGLNLSHTAVCFAVLAEGDYVELHVRQDSGGSLFALGSANADLCSLAMVKLS